MVTSHVARVAFEDRTGLFAERVPNGGAPTVHVGGAFDLIGGGCNAPLEGLGKRRTRRHFRRLLCGPSRAGGRGRSEACDRSTKDRGRDDRCAQKLPPAQATTTATPMRTLRHARLVSFFGAEPKRG